MSIVNQAEVTRFRQNAFRKHECMGYWKEEYHTMTLVMLCQELQLKAEQRKVNELRLVIRTLVKNGF